MNFAASLWVISCCIIGLFSCTKSGIKFSKQEVILKPYSTAPSSQRSSHPSTLAAFPHYKGIISFLYRVRIEEQLKSKVDAISAKVKKLIEEFGVIPGLFLASNGPVGTYDLDDFCGLSEALMNTSLERARFCENEIIMTISITIGSFNALVESLKRSNKGKIYSGPLSYAKIMRFVSNKIDNDSLNCLLDCLSKYQRFLTLILSPTKQSEFLAMNLLEIRKCEELEALMNSLEAMLKANPVLSTYFSDCEFPNEVTLLHLYDHLKDHRNAGTIFQSLEDYASARKDLFSNHNLDNWRAAEMDLTFVKLLNKWCKKSKKKATAKSEELVFKRLSDFFGFGPQSSRKPKGNVRVRSSVKTSRLLPLQVDHEVKQKEMGLYSKIEETLILNLTQFPKQYLHKMYRKVEPKTIQQSFLATRGPLGTFSDELLADLSSYSKLTLIVDENLRQRQDIIRIIRSMIVNYLCLVESLKESPDGEMYSSRLSFALVDKFALRKINRESLNWFAKCCQSYGEFLDLVFPSKNSEWHHDNLLESKNCEDRIALLELFDDRNQDTDESDSESSYDAAEKFVADLIECESPHKGSKAEIQQIIAELIDDYSTVYKQTEDTKKFTENGISSQLDHSQISSVEEYSESAEDGAPIIAKK